MAVVIARLERMSPLEFVRRNHGQSQVELERRLGLPKGSVSKFERGAARPWPAARAKLAEFFGYREDELFRD